jgi:hypothetical protein
MWPGGDGFPAWGCGFGAVMLLFRLEPWGSFSSGWIVIFLGSNISFFEF